MNMKYTVETYDPGQHLSLAEQICAAQAAENPQMFPLTPEIMARHPHGSIAHESGKIAVGYNAVTLIFPGEVPIIEIGGLYVMAQFRGGLGVVGALKKHLHQNIAEKFPNTPAVVFTNPLSESINTRLGACHATLDQIPSAALKLCATICETYKKGLQPGQICCDTILHFDAAQLKDLGNSL